MRVNANRRHYELAAQALRRADPKWLGRLIMRRVPLERWSEALEQGPDDVKVIVEFPQTYAWARAPCLRACARARARTQTFLR